MDDALQRRWLEKCLGLVTERKRPLHGAEAHIPVATYLEPARFDAERHLFRRSLNLVAHRSELPGPGSFLTLDVLGSPVLLARGDDGVARAFLNVCRHRGATVERRAKGRCKRFVCPYHAWSYDTDGALAKVRHREGFPSLDGERVGLTELACVEEGPFVFVCPTPKRTPELDDGAKQLCAEIEGLGLGALSAFARESRTYRCNWKLVVEGGIESYHFKIAHKATIGALFTDTTSLYERVGDHLRSILPRTSIAGLAKGEGTWSLLAHANVLYTISPNASILCQEGHFAMILLTPLAADACRIDMVTVGRPVPEQGGERVHAFLQANHDFTVKTLDEDFVLATEIQRGLATGANETLRFGRFEDALTDWHGWLDAKLQEGQSASSAM